MNKKFWLIGFSLLVIAFAIIVAYSFTDIECFYMEVFNKTGEIKYENSRGSADGQYFKFVNGKMLLKGEYVNGKIEGWFYSFYPNGQIKQRGLYKNNILQGIESEYFEDGKLELQRTYKEGLENGEYLMYYENGKLKRKGQRKNDKLEGTQYGYYESGKTKHISNYLNGKRYGDETYYHENGKLDAYFAYEIGGEKFYVERFSDKDSLQVRVGYVFGTYIYSTIGKGDSTVVLKNKQVYSDIKDLYITIAHPPNLNAAFDVVVNGKVLNGLQLDDNTLESENVFDKSGTYKIDIRAKLFSASNSNVKGGEFKITIVKK